MLIFTLSATRRNRVVHDLASEDTNPAGLFYLTSLMIDEGRENVNAVERPRSGCFI